ncbi:uncharacterized protein LOC133036801 [Cannabis sativa]|uniref:uncharacterized protein LOC133036801 n=1 Tax=Cannabis sativa TaxID=3483 RepID=UPI0029CA12D5|nr:uncharacterized protein LOC133036801 [Cannabis sativa]
MTDTEDDSSGGSVSKYKQLKAMNKVLGSRSDYLGGVGYQLKGSSETSSSTQSRAQSQVPTSSITLEDMGVFTEFMLKMRDKIDQSGTSSDASLHDPRFDKFYKNFYHHNRKVARRVQPPLQRQCHNNNNNNNNNNNDRLSCLSFSNNNNKNSPNISAGSSQSPQLHYMFGLPSQSPPIFFLDAAGGS